MISILALRAIMLAALAGVQGLAVVADGDRTQVLIDVEGQVTFEHGMLSSPPRIVVDVAGADFRLPQQRFLDINRGGVLALRSSQYQSDVVRVVIDLAEAVDYRVEQFGGMIIVSFPNPAGAFEPWRSDAAAAAAPPPPDRILGDPVPDPARVDRPATPVAVTRPPEPEPHQPLIWVEFRNTPIIDVLAAFADFSGRSIVPGQGVGTQTITATIQGQPWDEAMQAILAGQGLSAREGERGIIMVTSLEHRRRAEALEDEVTRLVRLRYISSDSAAARLRLLFPAREGMPPLVISSIREMNSIFVRGIQSMVESLEQVVGEFDQRSPQVTVRARIVSINRIRARELGFRYEFVDSRDNATRIGTDPRIALPPNISLAGSTIAAIGNAAEATLREPTFSAVTTLLLNSHALVTWIDAAQSVGLAELQADPTVRVMDNYEARIQVGQRVPIRVVDPGAAGAAGPQAQVRMEEVGVILIIRPSVVGDQVRLELHAERSFVEPAPLAGQFVFRTSETQTQITVDDGQTTVISGLTTTDLQRSRSGIPILMNLPLIGALFRFESVEEVVEDILIMVTPHIDRAPDA